MAGYGNRNAPNIAASDLTDDHANTRFGRDDSHPYSNAHPTYGSGATGGAGFGNKRASSDVSGYNNSHLHFGSHQDTKPYSDSAKYGSGTVGGAGYGNKTGSFGRSNDSTVGRLMEKAGRVMHNENLAEKGRAKRKAQVQE